MKFQLSLSLAWTSERGKEKVLLPKYLCSAFDWEKVIIPCNTLFLRYYVILILLSTHTKYFARANDFSFPCWNEIGIEAHMYVWMYANAIVVRLKFQNLFPYGRMINGRSIYERYRGVTGEISSQVARRATYLQHQRWIGIRNMYCVSFYFVAFESKSSSFVRSNWTRKKGEYPSIIPLLNAHTHTVKTWCVVNS